MTNQNELEARIKTLTEEFGITPVSVTAFPDGGFSLVLSSKRSADKLNEVFSKRWVTVLEKNPRRQNWYLTVKPE